MLVFQNTSLKNISALNFYISGTLRSLLTILWLFIKYK